MRTRIKWIKKIRSFLTIKSRFQGFSSYSTPLMSSSCRELGSCEKVCCLSSMLVLQPIAILQSWSASLFQLVRVCWASHKGSLKENSCW